MTCLSSDSCSTASTCTRHLSLAIAASGGDAATAAARIAALADDLRAVRSGSARNELLACGSVLAARFRVDLSDDPDALRVDAVLARNAGSPLVLGALAVTAARDAGIALGLLAGPHGRLAVAHATLARPLVLDLADGFALRDITGDEPLFRWLCAHETARRVGALLNPAPVAAAPQRAVAVAGSATGR